MTLRQRLLKIIYPLWMIYARRSGKNAMQANQDEVQPARSFYDLETTLNNGSQLHFSRLRGKKVLLVNTASDCGYTNQYADLQELYKRFENILTIIAFPANDFKEQEKGSDAEIASFCTLNYGVTFPIARKTSVIGQQQNDVFRWLSDPGMNGWNEQQPTWNFSKYLVSEDGLLLRYFDPAISPLSDDVIQIIANKS